jgi:hypothetical protein
MVLEVSNGTSLLSGFNKLVSSFKLIDGNTSAASCKRDFLKHKVAMCHRNTNTFLQRSRFRYKNCHLRQGTESKIPIRIHSEDGNFNVCRNVGKLSTFDAAYPRKQKLYILTVQFTYRVKNESRRFETGGLCCSTL